MLVFYVGSPLPSAMPIPDLKHAAITPPQQRPREQIKQANFGRKEKLYTWSNICDMGGGGRGVMP